MADIAERVRKLIQLAGSPSEEEARSAAYLACKLIREHKLELKEPGYNLEELFHQAVGSPRYQRAARSVAQPTSPPKAKTAAPPPPRRTTPPAEWEDGDPFSWMDPRNRPSRAPKAPPSGGFDDFPSDASEDPSTARRKAQPIEDDPDLDEILRDAARNKDD